MIERFKQGKLMWVNLKFPTLDEVQKVMLEFDLPPTLMTDFTMPVPKNSATRVGDIIKIILDFPVVKKIDAEHPYEVKFILAKDCLITAQYEEMEGIDRYKRQSEVADTLRKSQKHLTGAHLFFSLINNLYDSAGTKLDYVESKLSDIEDKIFDNNARRMVYDISSVSKKLITFRHIIQGHDDVFREAWPHFQLVYKDVFSEDLHNVQSQYFHLRSRTNTLFETLTALRETNTAMLTTRQNEIIKNLTIMAFITFPLTLLSSMFGMNTEASPIIGNPYDFWIIVGIMIFSAVGFFFFFKHKGWL